MSMCVTLALVSRKQTCNLPITVIPANRAKPTGEGESQIILAGRKLS